MKKIALFTLLFVLILSLQTTVLAVSVDYSYSLDKKLYENGQPVPSEEIVGNVNLGTTFQKDFGTVSLSGNLSYPLHERGSVADYLSLTGNVDFFEGGSVQARLNKESLSLSYMPLIDNNVSVSLGNSWHFESQETTQKVDINYDKRIGNDTHLNMNTNWNFNNFDNIEEASVSFGVRKSIHFTNGKVINTSIRTEVYDDNNENKQKDAGEKPVSGITFNLFKDGVFVKKVKTSTGGTASFGELEPGKYSIELVVSSLPQRFEITTSRIKEINLKEDEIRKIRFGVTERKIKEKTTFNAEL